MPHLRTLASASCAALRTRLSGSRLSFCSAGRAVLASCGAWREHPSASTSAPHKLQRIVTIPGAGGLARRPRQAASGGTSFGLFLPRHRPEIDRVFAVALAAGPELDLLLRLGAAH